MADAVALRPLPPAEAIDYFRAKGYAVGFSWKDVWQEEHARAFTVAKAMQVDVLETIRGSVDRAIAEGISFQQFQDELTPELQRLGWWGKQAMADPLSGETRVVQLGSPRRLQTIFDVNLRTAYAAGHWQRIQRVKAQRPYLRYTAVLDARTRPQHREWHGTILEVDDAWWATHYPPNGWRCRCQVVQLSARDLARRGWKVSDKAPAIETRPWTNDRTGETLEVPEGIDPGFGYNTGAAGVTALEEATRQLTAKLGAATPSTASAIWPSLQPVLAQARNAEFAKWFDAVDAAKMARGDRRVVGLIPKAVETFLAGIGIQPKTLGIVVRDEDILHWTRASKAGTARAVPAAELRRLPEHLDAPSAIYWDLQSPGLIFAFNLPGAAATGTAGKFVIVLDYVRKGATMNIVKTATVVPERSLANPGAYHQIQ